MRQYQLQRLNFLRWNIIIVSLESIDNWLCVCLCGIVVTVVLCIVDLSDFFKWPFCQMCAPHWGKIMGPTTNFCGWLIGPAASTEAKIMLQNLYPLCTELDFNFWAVEFPNCQTVVLGAEICLCLSDECGLNLCKCRGFSQKSKWEPQWTAVWSNVSAVGYINFTINRKEEMYLHRLILLLLILQFCYFSC